MGVGLYHAENTVTVERYGCSRTTLPAQMLPMSARASHTRLTGVSVSLSPL